MDTQTLRALEIIGYYVAAFLVTGILGGVIVTGLYRLMVAIFTPDDSTLRIPRHAQLAALIGVIERVLYSAAVLTGTLAFVGVWVVLKTIGEWGPRQREQRGVSMEFMVAQVTIALSILVGVGSGFLMQALLPSIPPLPHLQLPLSFR